MEDNMLKLVNDQLIDDRGVVGHVDLNPSWLGQSTAMVTWYGVRITEDQRREVKALIDPLYTVRINHS